MSLFVEGWFETDGNCKDEIESLAEAIGTISPFQVCFSVFQTLDADVAFIFRLFVFVPSLGFPLLAVTRMGSAKF